MLSADIFSCHNAECHNAKCHYNEFPDIKEQETYMFYIVAMENLQLSLDPFQPILFQPSPQIKFVNFQPFIHPCQ